MTGWDDNFMTMCLIDSLLNIILEWHFFMLTFNICFACIFVLEGHNSKI
jgi:hypothetical protein